MTTTTNGFKPILPDYRSQIVQLRAAANDPGISAKQRARTQRTIERMEADLKASEIEEKARENAERDAPRDELRERFDQARAKHITRNDKAIMAYEMKKHR